MDPQTGLRKRTVITERVLTTRTYHSVGSPSTAEKWQVASSSSGPSPRSWRSGVENGEAASQTSPTNGHRLTASTYEARTTTLLAEDLKKIEVEQIPGEFAFRVSICSNGKNVVGGFPEARQVFKLPNARKSKLRRHMSHERKTIGRNE